MSRHCWKSGRLCAISRTISIRKVQEMSTVYAAVGKVPFLISESTRRRAVSVTPSSIAPGLVICTRLLPSPLSPPRPFPAGKRVRKAGRWWWTPLQIVRPRSILRSKSPILWSWLRPRAWSQSPPPPLPSLRHVRSFSRLQPRMPPLPVSPKKSKEEGIIASCWPLKREVSSRKWKAEMIGENETTITVGTIAMTTRKTGARKTRTGGSKPSLRRRRPGRRKKEKRMGGALRPAGRRRRDSRAVGGKRGGIKMRRRS
mmetsp:Transcript_14635/g.25739  ORF Transcript_14635/g.25739 Transcript_14635/m.25739 type:complete len:257 (+) Transcript_14635:449-1219(+)